MIKILRNKTPYLKQTSKEIEEASKLIGITPEQGELLVNNYFRSLKLFMDDDRMPEIKVSILGTFKPTLGRLRRAIMTSYRSFKNLAIPRRIHEYRVRKFMVIRRRLIQLKQGKNIRTFWNRIPSNFGAELYKDDLKYVKDFYFGEEKNNWRESVGKEPYKRKVLGGRLE